MCSDLVLEQATRLQVLVEFDNRHVLGELREKESFLQSAVAASDHEHLLRVAVEGTVARRAEVNARADEVPLPFRTGASIHRAGRDEDGVRLVCLAGRGRYFDADDRSA